MERPESGPGGAIRRRIRRGELYAVQGAGRHGPTWRVLLSGRSGVLLTPDSAPCSTPGATPSVDGARPSITPSSVPSVGEDGPALLQALRILDALRRENRDLAAQVGYLQARVHIQEETIRALQAPQDAPVSPTAPDLGSEPGKPTKRGRPGWNPPSPAAPGGDAGGWVSLACRESTVDLGSCSSAIPPRS